MAATQSWFLINHDLSGSFKGTRMLKNILVTLDKSKSGREAQHYALRMARAYQTSITAVGIVDTPWITAPQPEPLGGSAFKIHRDEELIKQSHHHIKQLFAEFESACASNDIVFRCVEAEGFPSVVIERLSHEHDIIIMGKTTDFHFDIHEQTDRVVKNVARDNSRPLIIVPESPTIDGKILVTLDGSVAASRALHMFLLLGLAKDHAVEVLSVHKDQELAQIIAQRGVNMCHVHNVNALAHTIQSHGDTASIILERGEELKATLIIMGGFSHSVLKAKFLCLFIIKTIGIKQI